MKEKEILKTLRKLRQIKPEKDWVKKTKFEILGEKEGFFFYLRKPIIIVLTLIFLSKATKGALPGEPLYLIKRSFEKVEDILASEEEKSKIILKSAQKRTEELSKIVEKNETKKLAPAIEEVKKETSKAAKVLVQSKRLKKDDLQKVLTTLTTIEEVEKKLETEIQISEYEKAIYQKIKTMIEDLEKMSLTPVQSKILEKAKEDLKSGDLESALTKVLMISQNE